MIFERSLMPDQDDQGDYWRGER